jgi:D-lactate dehydrogenase
MSVLACDLEPDRGLADELGFTYTTMAELLEQSDVISIHVPGGPATRDLISTAEFEAMKKGVVLINTARGSVVDVSALVQALATGKVAAAGLDVIAEEPTIREEAELLSSVFSKRHNLETLLADHILLRMRNVVITPHNAFNTREAIAKILTTTRSNINAFVSGVPQNLVLP